MATIIPIAGGKGGVGKTFLTANLAIALAELNKKTIVVDLDLGGSNLYSWLGLNNTYPGIGDFLFSGKKTIDESIIKNIGDNLFYIPGDGQTAGLANIKHQHKLKILRTINSLQADFVLLDLSAGTTYNTLDFFRISRCGIIVTIPETTSIMNVLGFFKNFLLRVLTRKFKKNQDVLEILDAFKKRPAGAESSRIADVIEKIERIDIKDGAEAKRLCKLYVPRIAFNMANERDDLSFGIKLRDIIEQYLMMDIEFIGFLYRDEDVTRSVNKGIPFLDQHTKSGPAGDIRKMANRLVKFGNKRIESSFERLYASLEKPDK